MVRVSVIVPNYNYAPYLEQRMESILSQTYEDYEIIILDDKSTDNSLEIINKYRNNPKVSKVILNEVNSGSPFIQWERGINASSGDIIWIAESDDTCTPSFLETLVKIYDENNSVLAFCRSMLVNEHGNKLRKNHQMSSVSHDVSLDGKRFINEYLCYSNEVQNASCAIFSKQVAKEIDKDYMSFKGAGDWLFWLKIAEKGSVSFSNSICNNYRLHNNTTSKVVRSGLEFREMKTIYEWLYENHYINCEQLEKCKYNNLRLIASLKEIPTEIQKDLYRMWGVKPYVLSYLKFRCFLSKIHYFLKYRLK